jgi:hypothetical protein
MEEITKLRKNVETRGPLESLVLKPGESFVEISSFFLYKLISAQALIIFSFFEKFV